MDEPDHQGFATSEASGLDSTPQPGQCIGRYKLLQAIGEGAFRRIMTDERLADVPKVIETPKLDDATATDARMLALLRSYLGR